MMSPCHPHCPSTLSFPPLTLLLRVSPSPSSSPLHPTTWVTIVTPPRANHCHSTITTQLPMPPTTAIACCHLPAFSRAAVAATLARLLVPWLS
ncbi:hypothetical protein NL676_039302 [Syzygium grande]|nr:hypothetical protein NL676_039302 [Syzygium grande]